MDCSVYIDGEFCVGDNCFGAWVLSFYIACSGGKYFTVDVLISSLFAVRVVYRVFLMEFALSIVYIILIGAERWK